MIHRNRRLRTGNTIRNMVSEHKISLEDLIYPIFIEEGENLKTPIQSMPNIYRYSLDRISQELDAVVSLKIRAVLLFGIPNKKDAIGSESWNENGILQKAIRFIKKQYPNLYVISDICFCEYTNHGHCGVVSSEKKEVDNDKTLENIAKQTLSHAKAGVDMVAPSGMMDGAVGKMRAVLDANNFVNLPIMAYSVKYASAFYGPFRDAVDSCPSFGDRKTYQMNPANRKEAFLEAKYDDEQGADILMVKPALVFLDIVRDLKNTYQKPIACYNVSGEYAMIKAAAAKGWINENAAIKEILLSMKRAGADLIITYFAKQIAKNYLLPNIAPSFHRVSKPNH